MSKEEGAVKCLRQNKLLLITLNYLHTPELAYSIQQSNRPTAIASWPRHVSEVYHQGMLQGLNTHYEPGVYGQTQCLNLMSRT